MKNFADKKSPTGECIFVMPDWCEDVPELVKKAGADAENAYTRGKEVHVFLTKEQYETVSFDIPDSLTKIRIPDGVTVIKFATFERCTSLVQVIIPDTVEVIEKNAFMFCQALKKIDLPKNLKSVYEDSFSFCEKLEEIIFPDGMEYIDIEAFKYCPSLERMSVPNSVKKFGEIIFIFLSSVKELYFRGTREQWKKIFAPAPARLKRESDIKIIFLEK